MDKNQWIRRAVNRTSKEEFISGCRNRHIKARKIRGKYLNFGIKKINYIKKYNPPNGEKKNNRINKLNEALRKIK